MVINHRPVRHIVCKTRHQQHSTWTATAATVRQPPPPLHSGAAGTGGENVWLASWTRSLGTGAHCCSSVHARPVALFESWLSMNHTSICEFCQHLPLDMLVGGLACFCTYLYPYMHMNEAYSPATIPHDTTHSPTHIYPTCSNAADYFISRKILR